MPTLYCSRCSRLISFDDTPPRSCPDCGFTFDNAADSTNLGDGRLPETITATLPPHKNIGRYEARYELGVGAFGTVYLAYDPKLDRLVAIKCPNERIRHNPEFLERFAREGRNAAQLRHAAIVTVYDVEENEDGPYIVSEYVKGETLSRYLRRGRLSFRAAASMVAAVAAAVQYAHARKIVHRDIKPSNVMIDEAGNPRLMDFGLAKREDIDETVTVDNQILGTIAYMSPEQLAGKPQGIDHRTDIYSLGVMLYQLLTEKLPFRSDAGRLRTRILNEEAPRPRTLDKQIPIDLETICLKAMERDRERRYKTAGDMAEDLERWLHGEPILARHIGRPERAWRWAKRNPAPAALVGSIALLLAVSTAGAFAYAGAAKEKEKEAVGRERAEFNARTAAEDGRDKAVALQRVEAEARKAAESAEKRIQELLSRAYVERGERYIRAPKSSDDYNPIKALPWMLAAMKLDEKNPDRALTDRIRLQMQLDLAPRVERMWFSKPGQPVIAGLSPRRNLFFIAKKDGTVDLWRTSRDGTPVFSLAHPGAVSSIAFSPDGRLLATGCTDGVRIWSVESGALTKGPISLPRTGFHKRKFGSGNSVFVVRFGLIGRLLFASSVEGTSQTLDVETGEQVGPTIDVGDGRRAVAASFADSDRCVVVTGADDESTRLYDVLTGAEKSVPRLEPGAVITVSRDGGTIASMGRRSGRVVIWNAASGKALGEPLNSGNGGALQSAEFCPSGALLATGSSDGSVCMWSVSTGRLVWRQKAIAARQLGFSADGSLLAVLDSKKKVCTLSVQNGQPVGEPVDFAVKQLFVDWTERRGEILTVGMDGVTRLWNIQPRFLSTDVPQTNALGNATVSADRRVMAAVDGENAVWLCRSTPDGRFDRNGAIRLTFGDLHINGLALADDASRLAVASQREVFIWDTAGSRQISGPLLHSEMVNFMKFDPAGRHLVCLSYDGRAAAWDVITGRRLYEPLDVGKDCSDLDIDRSGRRCAVAAHEGVTIWELATGKRLQSSFLGEKLPYFVRFLDGPDHLLIAWRIRRSTPAQVWDLKTAKAVHSLSCLSLLLCVDVSNDRKRFLTGDDNGIARLWSSGAAAPVSPPFEETSALRAGFIDPTGRFVLTLTRDGQIRIWDAKSADPVAAFSLESLDSWFQLTDRSASQTSVFPLAALFSFDGRSAHFLMPRGLLITIALYSDGRPQEQIAQDVSIRSSAEFDAAGGMRLLSPDELAARWTTAATSAAAAKPRRVAVSGVRYSENNPVPASMR